MRRIFLPILTLSISQRPATAVNCPGSNGDALCLVAVGPTSYCVPGVWKCLGSNRNCGCDFSVTTALPSTTATKTIPFSTQTSARPTLPLSTTVTMTTTTQQQEIPPRGGDPLFIWAEWPDIYGEAVYRSYYAKLLSVLTSSSVHINRVILRITNPTLSASSFLWTVSTSSVLYQSFLSQLPPTVTELMVYPYLLTASDQSAWITSMNAPSPLEGVFKYASRWNALLANTGLSIRFQGVVVDGEEKVGFAPQLPLVPTYKQTYNIGIFGYATGYSSVGDWNRYGPYVDHFYLEMYDFYVYNSPTLQLVQNTDVASSSAFVTELNNLVLPQSLLKNYNNPKFQFMWSVQNSASTDCLYPLNGACGIKEDFGTQSLSYFLGFLAELKAMYPATFGTQPNGIFQFSFIPNSWFP